MSCGRHVLAIALLASSACSPTSPDPVRGEFNILIRCDLTDGIATICTAQKHCFTRCQGNEREPDITSQVEWSVDNSNVVRQQQRNRFVAVSPGDTKLRAMDPINFIEGSIPLGVFPGTPPLQTIDVWGTVREAGTSTPQSTRATIEFTNGLVAGRRGEIFVTPETWGMAGVPAGSYELVIRGRGYVTQMRTVTVRPPFSTMVNFELVRE